MDFSNILNRLALAECRAAGAPDDRADVAAVLVASKLRITDRDGVAVVQVVDDRGTPRIGNVRGDDMEVAAFVAEVAKASPLFFQPTPEASTSTATPPGTAAPAGETVTEQMRRLNAERAARSARADEAGVKGWPNPWKAGAENLSRQMALMNLDPARAARFQAEAGVR